jgi:predicted transcriptional regulator
MNKHAILLSIAPEFAKKIAAGTKTTELRRRFPKVPIGTFIYLYATLPVGAVIGRAQIGQIESDSPSILWKKYKTVIGISKPSFDKYFDKREIGFAISIVGYQEIRAVKLEELRALINGFVVPQSYRYLDDDMEKKLTNEL